MRTIKKYSEDNYVSNFGCPLTTSFRTECCYPARYCQQGMSVLLGAYAPKSGALLPHLELPTS